ncbi:hypothetical protein RAMDARK_0096 [Rickettsia amblyommatis str. Darkwater]|uniref:Uncharacterized protein n=1 Tax=Rickettsia amblyommatis str. Ac/Pa TaxID=1359164 RepID=A0A0F3N337_RICAM|nr:hypothetical protein APHACPA_0318 [Rickettsia amblyommatis str. Ac/Pa]KJV97968.1 hypothetical protein RAMDARK_0096 [Rickettsia amblyommatis str. Darkwater]
MQDTSSITVIFCNAVIIKRSYMIFCYSFAVFASFFSDSLRKWQLVTITSDFNC